MGQVTVRVNGYTHTIGCKDGEEQHVIDLTRQIEDKVRVIRTMGGQLSEARMLLHVSLLLADEAADLRAELARVQGGGAPAADPALAERLTRIAERIEGIAQGMGVQGMGVQGRAVQDMDAGGNERRA